VSELWRKSAVELAAMIRDREVSSREVVQAHLDRVEAVNPHLNAIVRLLPEEAIEQRLGPLTPIDPVTEAGSPDHPRQVTW